MMVLVAVTILFEEGYLLDDDVINKGTVAVLTFRFMQGALF